MNKPAFLEKIAESIKNTWNSLKDRLESSSLGMWVNENKKLALLVSALFSVMVICVILLLVIQFHKKTPEKKFQEQLHLSHELVIPDGPELPKDYTVSREKRDSWTKEEAETWFTAPSEADMKGLEKANDIKIDNILGAAP